MDKKITGEYAKKGDYHKHLDKTWKYYPFYVVKMEFIKKYLSKVPKNKTILDVGCGEGVLVNEFKSKGYNIKGLDYNYSSKNVLKGDITNMKLKDNTYDLIMALDVLEHLSFADQELAVKEMKRIIKKSGRILLTIPNLSHFASRFTFLFLGKLLRTSEIERHIGDRPISEYLDLFRKRGLKVTMKKGQFPTYPISSALSYTFPGKTVWLHRLVNKFVIFPNWCFTVIVELKK
ncbi:MAG: class I SAM-dependent methyltransferase [archaeon]